MTKRQICYRTILLEKIHNHSYYKSLEDWEWREFLSKNYKTCSSKLLGINELKNLILMLDGKVKNALNDKKARAEITKYLKQIESSRDEKITIAQIEKMLKIKKKLNLTNRNFWNFIDKKVGYFPFRLNLIQKLEANKVISELLRYKVA